MFAEVYEKFKGFAASWWFPFFVGSLSGINMFTIVLSAPTALLYVSQVIAKPSNWIPAAIINAAGTMLGVFGVMYMVELNGTDWIEASFPSIFASKSWDWTKGMMTDNGALGTVVASAMPVILHPIILFGESILLLQRSFTCMTAALPGMMAKMDHVTLCGAIFIGRFGSFPACAYLNTARFFSQMSEVHSHGLPCQDCAYGPEILRH
jgi:hypothetical protein